LPLILKKEGVKTLKLIPTPTWAHCKLLQGQESLLEKAAIEFMYYLQVKMNS
jgi:hypothetical protein